MRVAMTGRRSFLTLPEAQTVRANQPRPWPTAPCQQLIQWSCRLSAPSTSESTQQGQHRRRGSFRSLQGWISSATLMPLQDAAMSHVVSRARQLTGSILPSGKRAERGTPARKSNPRPLRGPSHLAGAIFDYILNINMTRRMAVHPSTPVQGSPRPLGLQRRRGGVARADRDVVAVLGEVLGGRPQLAEYRQSEQPATALRRRSTIPTQGTASSVSASRYKEYRAQRC
jgi:hypothetical protein